jgi:hypothetical protein
MPQHFSLYDIYALETYADSDAFDKTRLPVEITDDVRIEHVEPLLNKDTFAFVAPRMGTDSAERLESVKYALVHRFELNSGPSIGLDDEEEQKNKSVMLVRNIAACLRLIRPMRQFALSMSGTVREDGTFNVRSFDSPIELMETPENQKLFHLRNRDVDDLKKYAPLFLRAMNTGIWKFKMAAQFHELGHFQDGEHWKARYLLWSSAIESIYTSHNSDHKGSNVARERIKWFLGENTSIYPPGDLSEFVSDPKITIGAIIDDVYEVRNYLAHGDRIPDRFFQERPRSGLNGPLNRMTVLYEAQSFIIRHSMLRMLRDGLTAHFAGHAESEAYFGAQGLTNSLLSKKKKAVVP